MPVFTTLVRRLRLFSLLIILVGLLAAGCRSSQSAYRFQPTAGGVALRPAPADSGAAATSIPVVAAKPLPTGTLPVATARRPRPKLKRQLRQLVAQVATRPGIIQGKAAVQTAQRAAGPQKPSEVGLGTTVLGVLGLVVLPVSLIGLLIWGGPVWAVLAGLAALAVLIAYLDPFA